MKISEIITDKYKLRMPPTVYYELLADVVEAEEEQEPCEDAISRQAVLEPYKYLKDDDSISVWLIKKNIEQQKSVAPTSNTKQTIKCQDCKYRRKFWHEDKRMKNKGYWIYSCENNIYMGGDDEFCSNAERGDA